MPTTSHPRRAKKPSPSGRSTSGAESPARLLNLGERSSEWLRSVGISDADTLRALGAAEAFRRVKAAFPRNVSWVLLYALHGALTNTHWNDFPPEVKAQMREEVTAQGPLTASRPARSSSARTLSRRAPSR